MNSYGHVQPRKKKAIFVNGDFWHGRDYQRLLKNRPLDDYWVKKIKRNMERDRLVRNELRMQGWDILTVWEKDIKRKSTRDEKLDSIQKFLTD